MDALKLLQTRNSAPKLKEPGPSENELKDILAAAMRAPDHARLRPWRFLVIEGEARRSLGDLFARALRAPLIIAVATHYTEHPKVPLLEQQLSAGCAALGALLAAEALDYAGIWRTGANAFDPLVLRGLGLADNESLVGYLYIGTRDGKAKPLPDHAFEDFVSRWPAP